MRYRSSVRRTMVCLLSVAVLVVVVLPSTARAIEPGDEIAVARIVYSAPGPIEGIDFHPGSRQLLVAAPTAKEGEHALVLLKPEGDDYAVKAQQTIIGAYPRAFLIHDGDLALVQMSLRPTLDSPFLTPMLRYGNYTRALLAVNLNAGQARLLSMDCRQVTVSPDRRCAAVLCYPFMEAQLERAVELLLISPEGVDKDGLPDDWRQITVQWPMRQPPLYAPCWSADAQRAFIADIDYNVDRHVVRAIDASSLMAPRAADDNPQQPMVVASSQLTDVISWDGSANRNFTVPLFHDAANNDLFACVDRGQPRCIVRIDLDTGADEEVLPLKFTLPSDPNLFGWSADTSMPRFSPDGRYIAFAASYYSQANGNFGRYLVYDRKTAVLHILGGDRPYGADRKMAPFSTRACWTSPTTLFLAIGDEVQEFQLPPAEKLNTSN